MHNASIGTYKGKIFSTGLISSLCGAILHIVCLCAEKKVIRPHTFSVVTFMTDIQTLIKFSVSKLICYSMGHKSAPGPMRAMAKNTISVGIKNALPFPAAVTFHNFHPKSLVDGHVATHKDSFGWDIKKGIA